MGGVFCAELFLCYFLTVTDHGWCVLCWTPPVLLSNCDWLWLTITCHDWPLRMRSVCFFFSFFFFFCGDFFLYCFLTLADSDLLWLCAVAIPAHVIFWLWLMLDTVCCSDSCPCYFLTLVDAGHCVLCWWQDISTMKRRRRTQHCTKTQSWGPWRSTRVSSCTSCHSSNWAWTSPR